MTKLIIVSDSHDHIDLLRQAINAGNDLHATAMLHCGDLCAPFMLDLMGNYFKGQVHVVLGNNDGDGRLLQTIVYRQPSVTLHGIYAELTYGGREIAMIHYPEPAYRIAQSGHFHLVCYGHDHTRHLERLGDPGWLLNPGEIMGMKSKPSWAIYDCVTDTVEFVEAAGNA